MNHIHITTSIAFMIMLAALPGCNSKKEKANQPQTPLQSSSTSSKKASIQPVAPPQDEADAALLKVKVIAKLKGGDFAGIYKDASDGFRKVGPEEKFVALWQQQQQQTGPFKEAKEISHTVRPEDKFLLFIYKIQYEKANKAVRITFGRSKDGKMELTGINQRDPK
jgi:hypothetical protein